MPPNGTARLTAPATLAGPAGAPRRSIDPASPRGTRPVLHVRLSGRRAGGDVPDEGVGSVELTGKSTFTVHGLPITVVESAVTLNGLTGTLKASGATAGMGGRPRTYDRSKTQFTLDLLNATVTLRADGARTGHGIVPVSTADTVLAGFGRTRAATAR